MKIVETNSPEETFSLGRQIGQGICLIEWADLIRDILPERYTEIVIEKDLQKGFDYRRIPMTVHDNR